MYIVLSQWGSSFWTQSVAFGDLVIQVYDMDNNRLSLLMTRKLTLDTLNFQLQDFSDSDGEESYSEEEDSDEAYTPENAQKRLGAPKTHTPKLCDMITTPDFKGGLKRCILYVGTVACIDECVCVGVCGWVWVYVCVRECTIDNAYSKSLIFL